MTCYVAAEPLIYWVVRKGGGHNLRPLHKPKIYFLIRGSLGESVHTEGVSIYRRLIEHADNVV